eukprot:g1215.t1
MLLVLTTVILCFHLWTKGATVPLTGRDGVGLKTRRRLKLHFVSEGSKAFIKLDTSWKNIPRPPPPSRETANSKDTVSNVVSLTPIENLPKLKVKNDEQEKTLSPKRLDPLPLDTLKKTNPLLVESMLRQTNQLVRTQALKKTNPLLVESIPLRRTNDLAATSNTQTLYRNPLNFDTLKKTNPNLVHNDRISHPPHEPIPGWSEDRGKFLLGKCMNHLSDFTVIKCAEERKYCKCIINKHDIKRMRPKHVELEIYKLLCKLLTKDYSPGEKTFNTKTKCQDYCFPKFSRHARYDTIQEINEEDEEEMEEDYHVGDRKLWSALDGFADEDSNIEESDENLRGPP